MYLPSFTGYDFEVEYGSTFANLMISESTVSAVPEPSCYALMLAGLGLVGFMVRRKQV
ncbi:MAG: PEPxxWA-CTERM sorting domain-containing protein [Pseudomonadota bacterium]|nr:PEPxxWA-CTERM sorting domain-containing protein [Pseudomonadota bacterium]